MTAYGASRHLGRVIPIVLKGNAQPPIGYIGSLPLSARAGRGAVGIEEATMHTTIPTFVGFKGALEQGPPDRPEAPAQAERCLGDPGPASA